MQRGAYKITVVYQLMRALHSRCFELLMFVPLQIDDLLERRVDRWIRDFTTATHVLDVYVQKRVDKRKVFACQYMRIQDLQPNPDDVEMPITSALFGYLESNFYLRDM